MQIVRNSPGWPKFSSGPVRVSPNLPGRSRVDGMNSRPGPMVAGAHDMVLGNRRSGSAAVGAAAAGFRLACQPETAHGLGLAQVVSAQLENRLGSWL